ncbi:MAG TPA: cold shock domain-containing protein [Pirellulales bacterium]|nr:cold shock domain-containing protein [Pirellulales bacterium]
MPEGKVKKIVAEKGFGFIEAADGQDVFFHHSTVTGKGFDNLAPGQRVEYELEAGGGKGGKGPRASSVKPIQ